MKILKHTAIAVGVVAALLVGFFLWASSDAVSETTWIDVNEASQPEGSDTLTIMTYNVGYMSGMTNNQAVDRQAGAFAARLDSVAAAIERVHPDFVAFQEIDVASSRSFGVDQVETLAVRGGFSEAAIAVNWNERYVPFPSPWPWHHFGRMVSAQAVVSRYPIEEHRRIVLAPPEGAPLYGKESLFAELANAFYIERLAQIAVVDVGRPLAIVNVHLEAFDAETRQEQAAQLLEIYRSLPPETAVIVIGDFNSVMPEAKHPQRLAARHLERFRNDETMAILLEATGLDAALPDSVYATSDPATFTFSSADPGVKIDHILFESDEVEPLAARVLDVAGHPSDHRPVVLTFVLRRR